MIPFVPPDLSKVHEPAPASPARTGHALGDNPPTAMDPHERMQLRAAAFRITKVYPGIVGSVLADDLLSAEAFGYVLANGSRLAQLSHHALTAPLPASTPPEAAPSRPTTSTFQP